MNTLEFEYVSAVAKYKSFSLAAKKLNISQPALSSYINKLEKTLGIQLFDRSLSPIALTEPGIQYLECTKKILDIQNNFSTYLSDYNNLKTGTLVIGSTHCFTSCYLPQALSHFLALYPGIKTQIIEGRIPDIESAVLDGTIDIFITANNVNLQQFETQNIFTEEIFLAVPSDYAINQQLLSYQIPPSAIYNNAFEQYEPIDLRLFKDLNFILLQPDQHIYKMSMLLFQYFDFIPKVIINVEQLMSSFAFTLAGMGISIITESAIRLGNFSNLPTLYRLPEHLNHRTMTIAYKKNRYLSQSSTIFIDILKKTFNKDEIQKL